MGFFNVSTEDMKEIKKEIGVIIIIGIAILLFFLYYIIYDLLSKEMFIGIFGCISLIISRIDKIIGKLFGVKAEDIPEIPTPTSTEGE